ncbi:pectinesterase family protein [Sphingobacterium lactis]|uniref:pectinesterase family protein n=1 Tax=Sphingobacterium lactis TaxID=797291 RepID=UPI003DA3B885
MYNLKGFVVILLIFSSIAVVGQTIDNKDQLTVAQDGSGDFSSIQKAINHVRDHAERRVTIVIKPGTYTEKIVIPAYKRNISLIGLDAERTIIQFQDFSGKDLTNPDPTGLSKMNTYNSYTILVSANDCKLENLTIVNSAGRVGQAVALHIDGDRIVVRNCKLIGNQDTLYLGRSGTRSYFENCTITGTTDFIFGAATAFFEKCTIISLSNSYITAAATVQEEKYGFVFSNCRLLAEAGVHKVFLGRPWRPYAKVVFLNSFFDKHIVAQGWDPWDGDKNFPDKYLTVTFAEYNTAGPGNQSAHRVDWAKELTAKQAKHYAKEKVLRGWKPGS